MSILGPDYPDFEAALDAATAVVAVHDLAVDVALAAARYGHRTLSGSPIDWRSHLADALDNWRPTREELN